MIGQVHFAHSFEEVRFGLELGSQVVAGPAEGSEDDLQTRIRVYRIVEVLAICL